MGDIIDKVNELENGLMNTDYSPVELPTGEVEWL